MVTLVLTSITGTGVVGGGLSTLAFEDPVDDAAAEALLAVVGTFWSGVASAVNSGITFTVQPNPSRFAAATGALQEVFDAAAPAAVPGLAAGTAVPRASMALIRWGTADIVNNRVVKGRTFIPGTPVANVTTTGQLSAAGITDLDNAAEGLISGSGGVLSVWHRPVGGAGGSSHLVTVASVWDSFAVLRSRRD